MTIDPRIGFWLGIVLALIGVMAGAGSQLTDLGLSPAEVKAILAASNLLMAAGSALSAVLHAIPASKPDTTAEASKFALGPKA